MLVAGRDVVANPRAAAALVGIAPQDIGLYEVLTVRDNLRGFAALHEVRFSEHARFEVLFRVR